MPGRYQRDRSEHRRDHVGCQRFSAGMVKTPMEKVRYTISRGLRIIQISMNQIETMVAICR